MLKARPDDAPRIARFLVYLDRLVGPGTVKNVLVLGCGPRPDQVRIFREHGFHTTGVEPVASFVRAANEYLGGTIVLQGAAENIPLPDASQHLVVFESVLEHVDSPRKAMAEIFRVLAPGGVLSLLTTNRHLFHWKGENGEYRLPFFNWLPRAVKESYVFEHLHYQPKLANYTTRPAVHWFSYTDLCALGREVGFAHFYSFADLMREEDPGVARSRLRRMVLRTLQRNAWARALALTQWGAWVLMTKRR
jgi:ubiquinone/menaquinone biosynthesis C-methylase UbiE